MNPIVAGQLRAALTFLGGVLASLGWADAATVEIVGGAVLTIAGAAWSAWDKLRAR